MAILLASNTSALCIAPPVLLAPLAGITDLPFRKLVASFGAGLVVSEMVASQEVVQARPLARARAELGFDQAATSVQIAGRDPYWMAEAAKSEPNDPNAMALSTVDAAGTPDNRMVLLKDVDTGGFTFYSNRESAKARGSSTSIWAALQRR